MAGRGVTHGAWGRAERAEQRGAEGTAVAEGTAARLGGREECELDIDV